jgi:hypothetical protein
LGVSSGEGMRFSSCHSNVAARARFQSRSRRNGPMASADHGKQPEYESAQREFNERQMMA